MKTNMRDTSLDAYNDIRDSLSEKQITVLEAIETLVKCNDRQISDYLGWPINRVTPRRNELLSLNKITDLGTRKDPESGRSVHFWSVKVHQGPENLVDKNDQVTLF